MTGGKPDAVYRRQTLLAELGARVGRGGDLQALLTAAAQAVAEALDVDFAKVLEWRPAEGRLLVRAGVGWDEGIVGQATIGADLDSPAGFALKTGMPVSTGDLRREARFRTPVLLRRHGVASAANAVIRTRGGNFGVLEADSRRPRAFTDMDVKVLQGAAGLLGLAIDRQRLSDENACLLQRRHVLFRELQHRVKNNTQTLVSLMNLQLSRDQPPETRDAVRELMSRVEVLNLLESQLYLTGDIARLDLGDYLEALLDTAFAAQGERARDIALQADIAPLVAAPDKAKAVGLIVNEFVMNSFKHAFGADGGTLSVTLGAAGAAATLTLSDTGPGLPRPAERRGLGLMLIQALARQIGGSLHFEPPPGARLVLSFPLGPEDEP